MNDITVPWRSSNVDPVTEAVLPYPAPPISQRGFLVVPKSVSTPSSTSIKHDSFAHANSFGRGGIGGTLESSFDLEYVLLKKTVSDTPSSLPCARMFLGVAFSLLRPEDVFRVGVLRGSKSLSTLGRGREVISVDDCGREKGGSLDELAVTSVAQRRDRVK